MENVTICTYYKDGTRLGDAPVPNYSTAEIRRAIAKHIGINQYNSISFETFELGNHQEERFFNLTNFPTKDDDFASAEKTKEEVAKEAEPIT